MSTGPTAPPPGAAALRISLNVMLGAAIADALFLVALLVTLALGGRGAAGVPAALYAFGFIYLLYLAAKGAMDGRWGWSYLALVALTLGPIGALVGEPRMRARLPAAAAPPETTNEPPARKEGRSPARPPRREGRRGAAVRRRAAR